MDPDSIYLDNHATTRCDPRVVEAMLPYFGERYGNPGSLHEAGAEARDAVERARESIAAAIGGTPQEIVFTSGATESNNLALRGIADRKRRRGDHLVSVCTEHRAVLDPLKRLATRGFQLTLLEVEPFGARRAGWLDPQRVADALTDQTCLTSVMLANNEIGTLQPLAEIAALCRARGVPVHTDATQAVGKVPVDVRALGVDLMSFTSHKLYGPKGIGALYVRGSDPAVRLEPLVVGGGQELGRRSGTLNVPAIVGFARAVELCMERLDSEMERLRGLRDRLATALLGSVEGARLCGPALDATDPAGAPIRLPGNLNLTFGDVDGGALMLQMPEIAVSSGAACSSTDPEPSHVLLGLGCTPEQARASLRLGLGRFNTADELELVARRIADSVARLRQLGAAAG